MLDYRGSDESDGLLWLIDAMECVNHTLTSIRLEWVDSAEDFSRSCLAYLRHRLSLRGPLFILESLHVNLHGVDLLPII